jgi:hypothetical protein
LLPRGNNHSKPKPKNPITTINKGNKTLMAFKLMAAPGNNRIHKKAICKTGFQISTN